MLDQNALGELGEDLAKVSLTTFHGERPLFRVTKLGEKWPVADFIVELSEFPGFHFLAQVKTTMLGTTRGGRLRVEAKKAKFNLLAGMPIPRYLIGVDALSRRAYIASALTPVTRSLKGMPRTFCTDDSTIREQLHDEVHSYWTTCCLERPWSDSKFSLRFGGT